MPSRSLVNFTRLRDVNVSSTPVATFNINVQDLLLANSEGDLVSAPGLYKLTFETGSGSVVELDVKLEGAIVVYEPFPHAAP